MLWLNIGLLGRDVGYIIALAYQEVTHSLRRRGAGDSSIAIAHPEGSEHAGSMLQLPAVGGGSQMARLRLYRASSTFRLRWQRVAASCCGWLHSRRVRAVGIVFGASDERLSLRKLLGGKSSRGRSR